MKRLALSYSRLCCPCNHRSAVPFGLRYKPQDTGIAEEDLRPDGKEPQSISAGEVSLSVYHDDTKKLVDMSLEEYLVGLSARKCPPPLPWKH